MAGFDNLPAALRAADVVISTISCPQVFFTRALVTGASGAGGQIPLDLSAPRSVAPDVAQVPGVPLYNIDAIRSKTSAALA